MYDMYCTEQLFVIDAAICASITLEKKLCEYISIASATLKKSTKPN